VCNGTNKIPAFLLNIDPGCQTRPVALLTGIPQLSIVFYDNYQSARKAFIIHTCVCPQRFTIIQAVNVLKQLGVYVIV
jgi:hypothetical protein